jgi:head-tail adaptor
MSLIDAFKTSCTLLEKVRVSDGEGGFATTWTDGISFDAAITYTTTISARVAEREGMKSTYTVTTAKNQPLEFHDVFRRDSDGKVFRVTSDGTDKETPDVSSFQFSQVAAEEWELS